MKVTLVKVNRRLNAENNGWPMISDGQAVVGELRVPNEKYSATTFNDNESYSPVDTPRAVLGECLMVGKLPAGIRTSKIRSYYVHNDADNHPDKLVLPSEFPREELVDLDMNKLEKGDILYLTMNSLYLARPVQEIK
jgi:hypothetical protein